MKKCKKCNKEFPYSIIINGKRRNICNRVYSLECSPWGQHNTKQLIKKENNINDGHKICPKCKIDKPYTEFYTKRKGTSINTYCKICANLQTLERQRKFKKDAIDYKGSKCCICNYNKCQQALEFHHLDPSKKEFTISNCKLTSFNKIIKELDKCILVCANCHAEIHGGIIKCPCPDSNWE